MIYRCGLQVFLSTPSGWRATRRDGRLVRPKRISIHALRVEGDGNRWFNELKYGISIHALRVEGDKICEILSEDK